MLPLMAKRLADLGVPAAVMAGGSSEGPGSEGSSGVERFLQRRAVADALAFLRVLADERDDEAFMRCVRRTKGLGAKVR